MSIEENKIVHLIISGNVQGVGFRWFVKRTAAQHEVSGWVKNLDSGDVEVEAAGENNNIKSFIENIKNNHPYAEVINVKIDVLKEPTQSYYGFEIMSD